MKCIKKADKFMKVPEHVADQKVKNDGWTYCSKSEFKKSKNSEVVEKAKPAAKESSKKAKRQKQVEGGSQDEIDKMINKKDSYE